MGGSASKPARKLAAQTSTRITRPTTATSTPTASPAAPSSASVAGPPSTSAASAAAEEVASRAGAEAQGRSSGADSQSSLAGQIGGGLGAGVKQAAGAASEGRTANIVQDGKDPQLAQHLATLGPVKVARNRLTYRPTDQMLGILAARQRETDLESSSTFPASSSDTPSSSSAPISTPTPSQPGVSSERISATSLAQFFDDRKACRTRADVERLALEYDLGIELVDKLVRRFNTASLGEPIDSLHNAVGSSPNSEEHQDAHEGPQRIRGIWEEPKLVDPKQIHA